MRLRPLAPLAARLLAVSALALTPGCFTLDFDGDGVIDRPPPSGYEVDVMSCSNGRDDDQDGRIDCEDEDCLMRGHCGELVPLAPVYAPENRFDYCSDGVDNDDDGQFDCGDRGCQGIRELCCLAEFDDATCSDGIDNDGNGFADCADFSCRNGIFVTVCESESSCTDRIDNDGDRYIDCRDRDCEGDPACGENDCADGVDNDDNGATDCLDPACAGTPECPPESDCANGVDDNGDGRADCLDPSCFGPSCMENTEAACGDGLDNDGNGYIDCDDNNCRFSNDMGARDVCEATMASCTDRLDNNANGYRDCSDYSCQFVELEATGRCAPDGSCPPGQTCFQGNCTTAQSPCLEGAGPGSSLTVIGGDPRAEVTLDDRRRFATAGCTDGLDNDGDGFTDCEDWDCNWATARTAAGDTVPLVVDAEGNALCRYAGGRTCLLGPNAGRSCGSDADCGGADGSCSPPGPEGQPFVCP